MKNNYNNKSIIKLINIYNQYLYSQTYNINSIKNILTGELKDHITNTKIINQVLTNINTNKKKR